MSDFKKNVQALLRKLRRGSTARRNARQLLRGFDAFGIDLVFDVGANTGQFAREIRDSGFKGRIVSFEPLSAAHQELTVAAASDQLWAVHERCALGDQEGSVTLNIAGNSVSSSVLEMAAVHAAAAPGSAYVGQEETTLVKLDSVAHKYIGGSQRPFLKIDTQGFEWQVLTGARANLAFYPRCSVRAISRGVVRGSTPVARHRRPARGIWLHALGVAAKLHGPARTQPPIRRDLFPRALAPPLIGLAIAVDRAPKERCRPRPEPGVSYAVSFVPPFTT